MTTENTTRPDGFIHTYSTYFNAKGEKVVEEFFPKSVVMQALRAALLLGDDLGLGCQDADPDLGYMFRAGVGCISVEVGGELVAHLSPLAVRLIGDAWKDVDAHHVIRRDQFGATWDFMEAKTRPKAMEAAWR